MRIAALLVTGLRLPGCLPPWHDEEPYDPGYGDDDGWDDTGTETDTETWESDTSYATDDDPTDDTTESPTDTPTDLSTEDTYDNISTDDTENDTSSPYRWHAFLGGGDSTELASQDRGLAVALTPNAQQIFVVGSSDRTWSDGAGDPLHPFSDGRDVFIAKLDSAGMPVWHTFVGAGGDDDAVAAFWVPVRDDLIVVGQSPAPWTGPAGQNPNHAHSGGDDLFVLSLDEDGGYQWHTFFGAAGSSTRPTGLAVDSLGRIYVSGDGDAPWLGPGSAPPWHERDGGPGQDDVFVLALGALGAYRWHTFFGSATGADTSAGIALSSSGLGVCLAGTGDATWDGPNDQAPVLPRGEPGQSDGFVVSLNENGGYSWHTFLGAASDGGTAGADEDTVVGIVASGAVVLVAGRSGRVWPGPAGEIPLAGTTADGASTFLFAVDWSGAYDWHTFHPWLRATALLQAAGVVYLAGIADEPWAGGAPWPAVSGDDFVPGSTAVYALWSSGEDLWQTYAPTGSGAYPRHGLQVSGGALVVTGTSEAPWLGSAAQSPVINPGFLPEPDPGAANAFVWRLEI